MTTHEIKPWFLGMSAEQKARLLALVAHNLTVCARAASLPEVPDPAARRKLLGLNELLHLTTAHVMHLVRGDEDRYPDDVFLDILLETAEMERCEGELVQAFEWSLAATSPAPVA
jgi:hypothetical protein